MAQTHHQAEGLKHPKRQLAVQALVEVLASPDGLSFQAAHAIDEEIEELNLFAHIMQDILDTMELRDRDSNVFELDEDALEYVMTGTYKDGSLPTS